MRNAKLWGIGTALLLLVTGATFAIPSIVHAQSFRSGDSVSVSANEVVNSTLFGAGRVVDIGGRVDGDVFCGGRTVTISGEVNGDVICAAQTLTISGTVNGDIRVAGQTVTIDGRVARNATVAAQTFTTGGNSVIGGDLSIASESATLYGRVGRDVAFGAANLTINGTIERRITGEVERLVVGSGATVREGGSYTSKNNATVAGGATVGELKRTEPQRDQTTQRGPNWAFMLYSFVALLSAALILVAIKPGLFQRASQVAVDSPLKVVLVGFVASIVAPVVFIVLLISVIGIPLALLFGLVWLIIMLVSGVFSGYYLGRLLLRRTGQSNALLYVLLGVAILLVLSNIPILNAITMLGSLWFGLGMILSYARAHYARPRYNMQETATHSPAA